MSQEAPVRASRMALPLLTIAAAQLLIVMDGTIVTVGLPSIGAGLKLSDNDLNWMLTAYALGFGGLLLAGGRACDLFGRRRLFQVGLVAFIGASLLGGFATNGAVLIAARAVQGIAAAIIAPAALSLLAVTFPAGPARTRALGVYGAMSGLGGVVGLLLGGALTEYAGWRWIMFVNVPIAALVLLGTPTLAAGSRDRGGVDLPGAITATFGLGALVYAINRHSPAAVVVAVVCLAGFVVIQRRSRDPLVPPSLLADRRRLGANLVMFLMGAGMLATFYFVTLYLQAVRHYPPLLTGVAYVPMAVAIGAGTGFLGPRLLAAYSERTLIVTAMVVAAAGTAGLGLLTPDGEPWAILLPATVLLGTGLGLGFFAGITGGVQGVPGRHTGIASGLLNTSNQIGGALGLAALAGLAAGVTAGHPDGSATPAALTAGYTSGLLAGAACYVAAALIAAATFGARHDEVDDAAATFGARHDEVDDAAAAFGARQGEMIEHELKGTP